MNKSKFYMYIFITFVLSNTLASAEMLEGNALLKSIEGSDHENVNSIAEFYDGYVSGVADSTVNVSWCPKKEYKRSQLIRVIIRYYKSHSIDSDNVSAPAKELVLDALKEAYPCE